MLVRNGVYPLLYIVTSEQFPEVVAKASLNRFTNMRLVSTLYLGCDAVSRKG